MTRSGSAVLLRVTIRTAASSRVGAGHAARTTAVAMELERIGASVQWACDQETVPYLVERGMAVDRIRVLLHAATGERSGETGSAVSDQVADAAETLDLWPADWLIVDSYQLGVPWQRAARARGVRIAVFDDLADRPIEADLVINAAAGHAQYDSLAPDARVLHGLRYAITGDPSRPPAAGAGTLLLAFGAADPDNLTEATLRALARHCETRRANVPRTVIQLGHSAPSRSRVHSLASSLHWASMAPDGPTSPGAPTLAIGAAGVGLLERMRAGVPSVVLVAAPNQRALAEAAVSVGAAITVDTPEDACAQSLRLIAEPNILSRMSAAGRTAVDGRGAMRVAREMNRLTGVALRRATMGDAELLHRWRNDPSVRAVSHCPDEIRWADHVRWLEASLVRADRHVLVAERFGRPVGTLRFEIAGTCATVSIAVDPALHGFGFGSAILDAGDSWLQLNDARIRCCRAEIRVGNEASLHAFLAAGYLPSSGAYERPIGRRTAP